jgi:hypothetical protein
LLPQKDVLFHKGYVLHQSWKACKH